MDIYLSVGDVFITYNKLYRIEIVKIYEDYIQCSLVFRGDKLSGLFNYGIEEDVKLALKQKKWIRIEEEEII